MFYSKTTGGFYDRSIHGDSIPQDALEISGDEYAALMLGQSSGKVICADESGCPTLQNPPPPSQSDIEAAKVALVQNHMDKTAQALRYDNIATAVTYAEEPSVPRFQSEGQALRAWRSMVWNECYEILAEVQAGSRPVPTDEELIAALPQFELPS